MMTCESCPDCPVPFKRSRYTQPEWSGDELPTENSGVGCACRARKVRQIRRSQAPPPAISPPVFTLSLITRPHIKKQQKMAQEETCQIGRPGVVEAIDIHELHALLTKRDDVLVVDSRSFIEYNNGHIQRSVNVANSKIGKRRLEQGRVSVRDLLVSNCNLDAYNWVVVYDQNTKGLQQVDADTFVALLLGKLSAIFGRVSLLAGGYSAFETGYKELVDDKQKNCGPLASAVSQPCMPVANVGPTRVLPFLYLGSQADAHNRQVLWDHNITYVLNVSASCPKADFIPDTKFMRIAVNDNYSEKLMPHFAKAFNFLDRVRESNGCVLVHCLAGVSRSPSIAIAYVMKHLRLPSDDAYRFVKSKRPTISPNFNFLGQLLEYEKQLRREKIIDAAPAKSSSAPALPSLPLCDPKEASNERDPPLAGQKKQRISSGPPVVLRQLTLSFKCPMEPVKASPPDGNVPATGAVSPTTGISRLNFGGSQESISVPEGQRNG